MNIRKKIVIFAMITTTSLIASDLNTISTLIDKINKTKEIEAKQELMIKLNKEIDKLDRIDVIQAQDMIETRLKRLK